MILFAFAAVAAGVNLLLQHGSSAAGPSGAIYTTTFDGQSVNENTYASKDAVYLNGGPQNANASGLPDGTYYFQVTDPSGANLLSTDLAVCRQLIVAFGKVAAAEGPSCQHTTGIPNSSNGSTPVKLAPFDDTPNSGSEYKVWLIRQVASTTIAADGVHLNFSPNNSKTDNFKVLFEPCNDCTPTSLLGGRKFYDANANALFDEGEDLLEGVQILIIAAHSEGSTTTVVTTDESGNWSLSVPTGAEYLIGEFLPFTGPDGNPGSYWQQTAPVADAEGFQGYRGTANGDQTGINFGNICFNPDGVGNPVASPDPCPVSDLPPPDPTPTPTPTPCPGCSETAVISGTKFYDANANGVFDPGELPVEGVKIAIILTTSQGTTISFVTTDASGNWSFVVPVGADHLIGELIPDPDRDIEPGSFWQQTAPAADDEGFRGYRGTVLGDQGGFNFGNICFQVDAEGNPMASAMPCTISYPVLEAPAPTPTETPNEQ